MRYVVRKVEGFPVKVPLIFFGICLSGIEPRFSTFPGEARGGFYYQNLAPVKSRISVDGVCEGAIIVDVCSGRGNLGFIVELAQKIIRVDTIYADQSLVDRLTADSMFPEKYQYLAQSAFHLDLPPGSADVVFDAFGLNFYSRSVVFGDHYKEWADDHLNLDFGDQRSIIAYLRECSLRRKLAAQSNVVSYLRSFVLKLKTVKDGGLIIERPIDEKANAPACKLFLYPTLDLLTQRGVIDYEIQEYMLEGGYGPIERKRLVVRKLLT
ncbi:MAG: hypothetical protein ABIG95_04080 [Candidatus Woesearchaeota archaeon]